MRQAETLTPVKLKNKGKRGSVKTKTLRTYKNPLILNIDNFQRNFFHKISPFWSWTYGLQSRRLT